MRKKHEKRTHRKGGSDLKFRCPTERSLKSISRDLREEVCQVLSTARKKLDALSKGWPPEQKGSLDEIGELIEVAVHSIRSLSSELHSPVLEELGLEAAIDWLCERIQEEYAIQTVFRTDDRAKPIAEDAGIIAFQALCELMVNVVKHAGAKSVMVECRRVEDRIQIVVEDDGNGFDPSEARKGSGVGLLRIRQQMRAIKGKVTIRSRPELATKAVLLAPLHE